MSARVVVLTHSIIVFGEGSGRQRRGVDVLGWRAERNQPPEGVGGMFVVVAGAGGVETE